jgi:hypothetical protein
MEDMILLRSSVSDGFEASSLSVGAGKDLAGIAMIGLAPGPTWGK